MSLLTYAENVEEWSATKHRLLPPDKVSWY